MVVSETVSSDVSTKWYKGLVRSKQEHNDSSVQQPYIFSYEDPSVYAKYKPLYNPDLGARKEDSSEPVDAQSFSESAFKYSDNAIGTTEFTTQYETIFTYAEPQTVDSVLIWTEEPNRKRKTALRLSVSYVFIGLSVLLLIMLFPILCWICVKRIARTERLVVIRLGKRLRTKGPGFVVTLPFCDKTYRLVLDDQTIVVGPVSGQTRDEGEVEIHCEITYRINDPDLTYVSPKKSPNKIITTFAGTCMTAALGHLTWSQLEEGGGKQDLANEIVTSLNCQCGVHGLQIVHADCATATLTRAPPSPETLKRSKLSVVQKQLQNLSSLFFPGQNRSSAPKPVIHSRPDKSSDEENKSVATVAPSSVTPDVKGRSQSIDVPHSTTGFPSGNTNTDREESVSRSRLLSLRLTDASATRAILCSQVITRAQPYLSNDLVCRALDRATLQLVIGSDRIGEPLPGLKETTADEAHYSVLYLDAKSGRATMGVLSDPDVTVFVNATDLSEILVGRLDLMKAVTNGQVKIQGNTKALDKLRHLLFLRAV